MLKVQWTMSALRDLQGIVDYHLPFGEQTARNIVGPIQAGVARLAQLPGLGPVVRDLAPVGRYRNLVKGRYRVIYRVEESTERVLVLRIWDSRRNPTDLAVHD